MKKKNPKPNQKPTLRDDIDPSYRPTDLESRVLQVMLKFDPRQNGLMSAEIAPHVWRPLGTHSGRTGQNQAMGAQLMRICRLGLVTVRRQEFGNLWFLADVATQYIGSVAWSRAFWKHWRRGWEDERGKA